MPDDIIISELSNAPQIDDSAVFPLTQDNGGSPATFKGSMSQIAGKIGEGTTFTNLHTTSKTLVGALNELEAGGGGSTEIEGSASGSIATFTDGGNNIPCKSVKAQIVATQAGSGTPSPSNPRTISGFYSVNVAVSSKNLWAKGDVTFTGYNSGSILTEELPIGTYTISLSITSNDTDANTCLMIVYYTDGTNYPSLQFDRNTRVSKTITTTKVVNRIVLYSSDNYAHGAGDTATWSDIQIEAGSTPTAYEAPSVYTLPLPSTCYGGYGDVCKANGITETMGYADLGDLSWNYAGGTFRAIVSDAITPISGGDTTAICEIYNRVGYSSSIADKSFYLCANQLSASKYLVIRDDSYEGNTTNFTTGVTGKKIIFTLGTPTTLTTSALSIPTLSGTNNIYANCGDVDVEYFNENADEIAELVNVYPYEVSGVLTAGQTSITLSSGLIKSTSTIDVYTSDGTNYNSVSVSDGSVIITFDAQVSNLGVKVRIS